MLRGPEVRGGRVLTPEGEAELMKRQCLKRRLTPDDLARAILLFASEEAGAWASAGRPSISS